MRALPLRPVHLLLCLLAWPACLRADVADFEARVDDALERFYAHVPQARALAADAAGILVFPRVLKAGFGLGGAVGDGALRVGGTTVQYYRMTGVSFGFQVGAQGRTEILLFTTEDGLARFRRSQNWQAGVDGSIAIVKLGGGKSVDTDNVRAPIMGFIFDNAGLMYDLSLKGNKYWKIRKE
jgi:lipid-binding SYLF domain-containing protein